MVGRQGENIQIFSIFSTNILYIRNKYLFILNKYFQQLYGWYDKWQQGENIPVGYLNPNFSFSQPIFRPNFFLQYFQQNLSIFFNTYLAHSQQISFIFSTNTFNNCFVRMTNGSGEKIYQRWAIQATEMHFLPGRENTKDFE